MIKIEGPKDPTYTVTLVFEGLSYDQLLDLQDAVATMDYNYSQMEYRTLTDYIESKGP